MRLYRSKKGNDANSGTRRHPWRTKRAGVWFIGTLLLFFCFASGTQADANRVGVRIFAQVGGGHSAVLNWTLSADDNTTECTATAACFQNIYRAQGTCSASSSFSLLTATSLGAATVTYTDSTITPGNWCYGVTFGINGLESAKDTATVSLQPASPSGLTGTPH